MLVSACDDGIVRKLGGGFTLYSCVCYEAKHARAPTPVGVDLGVVRVDGLEATGLVAYSAVKACKDRPDVVLLDSVTIAGFNVVSPPGLRGLTGAPVLIVYKYRPSFERLAQAAAKAPGPLDLRLRVLKIVERAEGIETPRGRLYVIREGVEAGEAKSVLVALQVYSRVPEPLRAAHLIASEASRALGEGLLGEV